jgi:hypothetical protein
VTAPGLPEHPSEADLLFDLVKERHGKGLTAEQLAVVRDRAGLAVEAAEAMRAVRLNNADEPLSIFVPYDAEA